MNRHSKKGLRIAAVFAAFLSLFLLWYYFTPGPVRLDVGFGDFSLSETGDVMYIRAGIWSSAGYLKTVDVEEDGENLYLSFRGTHGLNNSFGARYVFPIELPDTCRAIWFHTGKDRYDQVLEKDDGGTWVRTQPK